MNEQTHQESMNQFLHALYPEHEHISANGSKPWVTSWTLPQKESIHIPVQKLGNLYPAIRGWINNRHVYFGPGLRKNNPGRWKAGCNSDIVGIPGIWNDIDIKGPGHKEEKLPRTLPEAIDLAYAIPELPPSMVVFSGGGVYPLWLFKEVWTFENESEQENAQTLLKRFEATIITLAHKKGFNIDSVSDLRHVIRLPGSYNIKDPDNPKLVKVLEYHPERRYNPDDFEPYLADIKVTVIHSEMAADDDFPPADLQAILNQCPWMSHCQDDAETLPEPEWYAMLSIVARCKDAETHAHELSRPYPGYSESETAQKLRQAKEKTGPCTCERVQKILNPGICEGCVNSVKGPIILGRTKADDRYPWPDIISYSLRDVPEIKAEMLPGFAEDFARESAKSIQVPESLAVATVLGAISLAATPAIKHIEVRSGYSEPPNLNIVSCLESGERKSAQLDAANRPILSWESEQAESMKDDVRKAISRRKSLEKVIEQKRGKLSKIKDRDALKEAIEEIANDEAALPQIKYPPRLLTDDCTPERMAVLMAENDEVIGVSSAEGGIFDLFDKRYSRIPNLDLFLKAHCAEKYIVDRMSREPVILNNPRLVMTLCPQPEVMESLTVRQGFRGRGVIARILYFLSNSVLGYRDIETKPIPSSTSHRYESGLRKLLDLRGAGIVLKLSPSAYEKWSQFARAVEVELRPGGDFEQLTDWAGKLPGAAVRIAGLFHCVREDLPGNRTISAESMTMALTLAALLADHAREALGQMGVDKTRATALKILKWIQNTGFKQFSARDCFRALQSSFKTMNDISPGLDVLSERSYIREILNQPSGPGRPSKTYEVNPEVLK